MISILILFLNKYFQDDSQSLIADESLLQVEEIATDNDNSISDITNVLKSETTPDTADLNTSEDKYTSAVATPL